jgi:hypothetical protein
MSYRDSALACSETATSELLSTDDISGRVIATKGFDTADAILRTAIRDQVGSVVKRLPAGGAARPGSGRRERVVAAYRRAP